MLQSDKRNEDVGSGHRAEKEKGTTNVFICLHMGDNFNFSCKLLHHSNEMKNTKLAFNRVINPHKFIVKLLEGWKFSQSPSFSVQFFYFVFLECKLEKQHFYRRTAHFITFS